VSDASDDDERRLDAEPGRVAVDLAAVPRLLERLPLDPEPAVVFTALAAVVAPAVCDVAAVVVTSPPADSRLDPGTILVRSAPVAADPARPGWFVAPVTVVADVGAVGTHDVHAATVECRWRQTRPTPEQLLIVELLCRQAVSQVVQARLHAAVAERENAAENLRRALDTNRAIGAAIGVLMATHGLTHEQAHQLLATASQRTNRKMAALADDVLYTGEVPA